jgi:GNAT superfamily N-acetyltransferase
VIETRQSRPEERGVLHRLEVESWLDGHGDIFPECVNRPYLIATGRHGWPLDPATQFADLVLVEDGNINGKVALFGQPDGYALVEAFYIRRGRRQQGLGKILWGAAIDAARAAAAPGVKVWAIEKNSQALRFYRDRCGEPTGTAIFSIGAHSEPCRGFELAFDPSPDDSGSVH